MKFFRTFEFDFEVRRLLWYGPYGGSDFAEVVSTCERIRERNYHSWYKEWRKVAEKIINRNYISDISRGKAYLRASRYFQAAEFFLHPADKNKIDAYKASVQYFWEGLDLLGILYEINKVEYCGVMLRTIFFKTPLQSKGTLYICGGFDALLEELYFTNARAALDEGYDVVLYEGPGQSHVIRYAKMPFTEKWDKVVEKIIAHYETKAKSPRIGVGVSLGGLLVARASGLNKTLFDKVVLFNYFPNMLESFKTNIPFFLHQYVDTQFPTWLERLVTFYISRNAILNWQVEHAKWTFGASTLNELLIRCREFKEVTVNNQVLICLANNDNYYSPRLGKNYYHKLEMSDKKLVLFDKSDFFSDLHCQNGAAFDTNDQIFEWLNEATL